jgi:cobalamin biosynthesis Co2+ chelatase CbiK
MVALPKHQSCGIAEDDTMNLNSFFERNMMNNKIFSRGLGEYLEIKRMALVELDN